MNKIGITIGIGPRITLYLTRTKISRYRKYFWIRAVKC
eukprot:UN07105